MELTMVSQAESGHIAMNWLHFINTVPFVDKSEEYRIRFIEQIYRVVVEGVSPHDAVEALLDREMSAGAEH